MNNFSISKVFKIKRTKKKVVLVGGTFDIVHVGHIEFLQKAKSFGDILIVGIQSDNEVRKRKAISRPIFNQKERALHISTLKPVDSVFITTPSTYDDKVVIKIKPDYLIFPLEYGTKMHRLSYKDKYESKYPWLTVDFVKTKSKKTTTDIITKILKSKLKR